MEHREIVKEATKEAINGIIGLVIILAVGFFMYIIW